MNSNWLKYGAAFVAGIVVGSVVSKNNIELRSVCTKALGGILDLKDKAMEAAEVLKESAEDLLAESNTKRKADSKEA